MPKRCSPFERTSTTLHLSARDRIINDREHPVRRQTRHRSARSCQADSDFPCRPRDPQIDITPSYSMSVLDLTVVQHGPSVSISGHVRRSDPWAETTWGYLEISLFDQNGGLIRKIEAEYSPRPIPRSFRSAYQPESRFSININSVIRPVHVVKIVLK
jgi:hypothetical protein